MSSKAKTQKSSALKHLISCASLALVGGAKVSAQTATPSKPVLLVLRKPPPKFKTKFAALKMGRLVKAFQAPMGQNGQNLWLLWMEKPSPSHSTNTTILVVEASSTSRRGWRLRRIVPLGETSREDKIAFHWLQPSQKSGPVLVRDTTRGLDVVAFPDGWEQKQAVRLYLETWTNPIQEGYFMIDGVDEAGFLRFKQDIDNWGDGYHENAGYHFHLWNGKTWTEGKYYSEK